MTHGAMADATSGLSGGGAALQQLDRLAASSSADALSPQSAAAAVALRQATRDDEAQMSVRAAAITAERERIAREMSDSASKSLLAISMIAASLASTGLAGDPRSLDRRLRELGRLARRAVTEASGVINDLREDAVASQLRSVAMAWSLASGINVTVDVPRSTETTELIRTEFGAILREALDNVEQHAHASHVRVSLRAAGEQLQLAIEDDGTGFSLAATEAQLRAATGGLARMRQRASVLDGVVLVRSSGGQGTRLEVRAPGPDSVRRQLSVALHWRQVRVAIADRNPVLRLGLRVVLEQTPGIEVVAEATSAADLGAVVAEHSPDVLLLDAGMALPGGLTAIRQLGQLTSVVMVTCGGESMASEAASAGARLCALNGEFDYGELPRIVHAAASAGATRPGRGPALSQSPAVTSDEEADSPRLCLRPREREIMALIAEGLSNRQIADRLVVSEKTVKNHISSIYSRLGVHGRSQAVRNWTLYY
jgi:DNA-binding NarL/FixJ family response regulator